MGTDSTAVGSRGRASRRYAGPARGARVPLAHGAAPVLLAGMCVGLLQTGCARPAERADDTVESERDDPPSESVHDAFLENLSAYCGQAFPGRVVHAPEDDPAFRDDAQLVMHVRECRDDEVRIPVHLEGDRSRTWIFTRTGGGLDLRHDHRHEDGRSEPVTFYGAFVSEPPLASQPPSPTRHEFKFERDDMVVGWVVMIEPGERYVYGTQRDGRWRHRFDFDLTTPVEPPPDPWGHAPLGQVPELPPAQEAWWAALAAQCGRAYHGEIVRRPAEDDLFRGDETLTVHFRECERGVLRIPFHVEENRSRTWILTRTTAGVDLRHDHRHPDGTPEATTWYGAHTQDEGTPRRQEFLLETDEGPVTGWAIEIVPGERYTYGTIRDGEWRYRLDFDLGSPVDPPPEPWGH